MAIKNIFVLLAILFNHVSAWRSAPSTSSFTRYSSKLRYSVGIDVGTGSARCGVFDLKGKMMGSASKAIATYQPKGMPELYEQVHIFVFILYKSVHYISMGGCS